MELRKAVLFDMDGVISDTQDLHARIESAVLADYGIDLAPAEITVRFAGTSDGFMFQTLFEAHKISSPIEEAISEKWRRMDQVSPSEVQPIPGALELIERVQGAGYKIALASSSRRPFIDFVVSALKIEKTFQAISSGDDVLYSKPDPAIFLLSAQKLGVFPEKSIVIEDSYNGLLATKRAAMKGIGLVDREDHRKEVAFWTVRSLDEITLRECELIFEQALRSCGESEIRL